MMSVVLVFLCQMLVLTAAQERLTPDVCHEGLYQKDTPSAEAEPLGACESWQGLSCCTAETAVSISRYQAMQLYNFTWNLCGNLSSECQTYLQNEQCFYECEPILNYFQLPGEFAVSNVPVCASYCNSWFQACRNDLTCTENWVDALGQAFTEGETTCPAQSTCQSFEEVFGDGRGLCNRMWGDTFFYSEDVDNCTVMAFDSNMPNPNFGLSLGAAGAPKFEGTVALSGLLALMALVIFEQ